MTVKIKNYLGYKLFNSLFFGFSVGTIFIIYEPLKPAVYSIGGILLALGTFILAAQYQKLMSKKALFIVLLIVELIAFIIVLAFLVLKNSLLSALIIYVCYQITFLFGNYVFRVETFFLKRVKLFSFIDMLKQIGYLLGLGGAFILYGTFEFYGVLSKIEQVYYLHYILVVIQLIVIFCLIISFKRKKHSKES
jgi:hypothetical protein